MMVGVSFKVEMKHIINKDLSIEEYKKRFSEIREEFLNKLKTAGEGYEDVKYLACDERGMPFPWVWNDESFTHDKEEGSLNDALQFASHMINDGMCFAFMGRIADDGGLEVWLNTFEAPVEKPTWPKSTRPEFEFIHGGVTRAQS